MNYDPNYQNGGNPYGAPLPPNDGRNATPSQPSVPPFSGPFEAQNQSQNVPPFTSANPFYGSLPPMTPPIEEAVDPETGKTEETLRVERMRKRIYWLLIGLSVVVFAFLLWEIVDFIGGYY